MAPLGGNWNARGMDKGTRGEAHVTVDAAPDAVYDLVTDVTRMDSAGIGMLVGKYMTVKNRGGMLRLLHLTDRTSRLLHVTRLETVFEIFEDEAAVIKSFNT